MKKFLKSINLKKFVIILLIILVALVSLLTASSVILNNKANEATLSNVPSSTKAIISTSDESFEEELSSSEVEYTKIGNTTYIVNYDSAEDASNAVYNTYSDNDNITTNYDQPFEIAGYGDLIQTTSKINKLDAIPDGMTLRDYADSVGKKVVAVIDTGVSSDYAVASKDFTGEGDTDENGHGTKVAQTILENADDKALILSLKALGKDGTGYMSSIMQAVQYAREQHVDVINMSISAPDHGLNDSFKSLIKNAISDGIQVVAAAGNYNTSSLAYIPANIDGVISVGAIDENNQKIETSNFTASYYEVANSTSIAAAKFTGKLVSGQDISSEVTEDKITYDKESTVSTTILEQIYQTSATQFVATKEKKETSATLAVIDDGNMHYYLYDSSSSLYKDWLMLTDDIAPYYSIISKNDGENKFAISWSTRNITFYSNGHGSYDTCADPNQYQVDFSTHRGNWSGWVNIAYNESNSEWPIRIRTYADDGYYCPQGTNYVVKWYISNGLDNANFTVSFDSCTKYTVTYNGNGGSSSRGSDTTGYVVPGSTWTVNLPSASRTYYNFKGWGWATDNNPNVGQAGRDVTFSAGNKTIYAAWEGKGINIHYEGNGGSGAPGNQWTRYGTYINLSSTKPTRTGYTFANWNTSASASPGQSDTSHILYNPGQSTYMAMSWANIIGDQDGKTVNLYAIWSENSYSVSYNLNKPGSTTPSGDTSGQTYKYTQSFNVHGAPSCTGYIFTGWNTAKNGTGKSYSANQSVSFQNNFGANGVTLYAQWKPITYNITFNSNAGQNVRKNNNTNSDQSVTAIADATKYQNAYGSTSTTTYTFDQTKSLPSNGFTWAGHTFLGWSENKNATTATYTNAQQITNLRNTQGANVTLYAIWRTNPFALTINPVSGSGTWGGKSSTSKGTADTYNDKAGNTKWGDKITLGDATAVDKSATITYDVQADDAVIDRTSDTVKWMFSRWIQNSGSHGKIFNNSARANDGSHDNGASTYYVMLDASDTVTAAYYWQTVKLPTPTREGYTFLGWYYDANCTDKVDGRGPGATKYPLDSNGVERTSEFQTTGNGGATFRTEGNVTLYARWQKNSFNYADTEQVFMQDKISTTTHDKVYLAKVDSVTGLPITGTSSDQAIIEIYKGSVSASNKVLTLKTGEGLFDGSGNKVIDISKSNNGYYEVSKYVTIGSKYVVHETQAKSGYSKIQDYTLDFRSDIPYQIVIENAPIETSFKAYKVDSEGNRMNGAVFRLDDITTGKTAGTFTSRYDKEYGDGFLFDGTSVTAGHTYSLVETSAPEGWQLASKVTFTVPEYSNTKLEDIVVTNNRKLVDLTIKKIDSKDTPVEGTTFQLYTMDADGEYQKVYVDADGNWIAAEKANENSREAIGTTNAEGIITFKQLPQTASYSGSEGEFTKSYYLKEVQAADGMSLVQDYMKITIPDDGSTSFTYTVQDDSVTLTLEAGGNGMNPYLGVGILGIAIALALSIRRKSVRN